jgi:hypothetical protein
MYLSFHILPLLSGLGRILEYFYAMFSMLSLRLTIGIR